METFSDLPPWWVIVESWLPETLLRGTWSRNPPASEDQSLSSSSSSSPTLCPEQAAGSPDCSSCNIGCLQDRGEGHNQSPAICTDQNGILMNSYDLCFSVRGIKCISGIPKRNYGKCHQKQLRLMALFYSALYNVPYISNEGQVWTADRSIKYLYSLTQVHSDDCDKQRPLW